MAPNASDLIKRIQSQTGGKRVGLYLNESVYEEAKAICDKAGISISNVVDGLLLGFVEEARAANATPQAKPSPKRG